ncbi:hypothetical protein CLOLEP_01156 [[Clostridium] leptum DSM 753]|uniref:Uncharacterized protein n=1 Tax=[Clostridium] leptum DSM 753 TaxID=428125 RepID=A7VRH3_9FIRM|nr:hypothetical protein CLOLEP_01156 [[Clostridium] leptum DSM 753]
MRAAQRIDPAGPLSCESLSGSVFNKTLIGAPAPLWTAFSEKPADLP